jgi:hypothetical protein
MGMSGQRHAPATLYTREKKPAVPIGGWVGLRAAPATEAKGIILCLCQGSNPGSPVCSQTLYRLIYPSS